MAEPVVEENGVAQAEHDQAIEGKGSASTPSKLASNKAAPDDASDTAAVDANGTASEGASAADEEFADAPPAADQVPATHADKGKHSAAATEEPASAEAAPEEEAAQAEPESLLAVAPADDDEPLAYADQAQLNSEPEPGDVQPVHLEETAPTPSKAKPDAVPEEATPAPATATTPAADLAPEPEDETAAEPSQQGTASSAHAPAEQAAATPTKGGAEPKEQGTLEGSGKADAPTSPAHPSSAADEPPADGAAHLATPGSSGKVQQALSKQLVSQAELKLNATPVKGAAGEEHAQANGTAAAAATPSGKASKRTTVEALPLSTHDMKNTVNASQLLKLGAFKLVPLKDFVPYDELLKLRLEDGIDATRREDYLDEAEFARVFGLPREAFKGLPAWKQVQLKKKTLLF